MKKPNLNLRGKLIVIVLVGVMVIFSAIGPYRIYQEKSNLIDQVNLSGQERISMMSEALTNLIVAYDYSNIESLAERIVKQQDVLQITIRNRAGRIMVRRENNQYSPDLKFIEFAGPIGFQGEPIGRVELKISVQRLEKAINLIYFNIFGELSLIAIFFGLLIYASVSVFIVKPLSRLSQAADQLALGDYSAGLPEVTTDEVGKLVTAFSSMRESRKLNESRLIAIFDSSPDALIQLDPNGMIVNWNDNATLIFNFEKKEILGRNFNTIAQQDVTPTSEDEHYQHRQIVRFTNIVDGMREVIGQRKNGSIFPLELKTGKIMLDDGISYIVSARDISERKQSEAKLLRAMKLAESANIAKSMFLSNISHEIRTPMNSIIGMASLALKTQLDAKQRDYLVKIDYSAHHLLILINDILDFSKIEAQKLELEVLDFELGAVVENLSNQLALGASNKGLGLIFEIASCAGISLRGDPLRLAQILLNYTSNAIKFTARGEVTVRARIVIETEVDYVLRFEVQDSGIGIGSEEVGKLFQSFHQSDASTTRKYGGTGLGLAISKQLVELMGGKVGVESRLNEGSKFWFTARFGKGSKLAEYDNTSPLNMEIIEGSSILLVEDNLFNQQVALEMLREVGVNVSIANNGQEAIELLNKRSFDCVLMDVQMPIMDGLEATRQIRATPALSATRIIAMTANAGREDKVRCFEAGMDNFISKPISFEQLYTVLAKYIGAMVSANSEMGVEVEQGQAELNPPTVSKLTNEHIAMKHANNKVIDLTVLTKMMGSDPVKVKKFALKFLLSAQQGLLEIDTALGEENMQSVAALGHRNKSPARTVGAESYAELCQLLEQCRETEKIAQAGEIVAKMRRLLQEIEVEIRNEVA